MALNIPDCCDDTERAWLRKELENKDVRIAKNWQTIADLARIQIENNKILSALAVRREEMKEEMNVMQKNNENLAVEIDRIKKKDREIRPVERVPVKVRSVIARAIVLIITTGVLLGAIRYAYLIS